MRTRTVWLSGAALAFAIGYLALGPPTQMQAEPGPAVKSSPPEEFRLIHQKLDDIKLHLAEVRAENEDLKTRLRELSASLEHLAGGKAVKPDRPKVEKIPDSLPELKPLPDK